MKNFFNGMVKEKIADLLRRANSTSVSVDNAFTANVFLEMIDILKKLAADDVRIYGTAQQPPACADCRHCLVPPAPRMAELGKYDGVLVTGDPEKYPRCSLCRGIVLGKPLTCWDARKKGFCGKRGKFFEPKDEEKKDSSENGF